MADSQLGWSEAQWEKVNSAVAESFAKASVAGAFLPCYGPLAGSAENVREEILFVAADGKVTVANDATKKLFNLTVKVELSSEQVADDALTSALLAFRRAANKLALEEDVIVFKGYDPGARVPGDISLVVNEPDELIGLLLAEGKRPAPTQVSEEKMERTLVKEIAKGIAVLETRSHPGPFACVLGHDLFVRAHNPTDSMVMAADRITPMLGGALLRSSGLDDHNGIVVSLAGEAIDIVVATPPTVQFLQRTLEAKYLFRVYERFRLRIKDDTNPAVYAFQIESRGGPGGSRRTRKRGAGARKGSAGARKRSAALRKGSAGAPKRSAAGRKGSVGTRKRSAAGRKGSAGARNRKR